MGTSEAIQKCELGAADTLYVAQADVQNCFYQCQLPRWLMSYFCLDPITSREALEIGLLKTADEVPLHCSGGTVFPCLQVLAMGWSWSFWIATSS